jgi:signal transduction histidine kinase
MTLPERFLTFHGPSEPMPIHGDPDRLTRAVSNLIENAAHATRPRGHIAVTLELQDGLAMIDVIDDGPGIPPDQVERVFDRFVRLDQARSGSSSGLGLPIARAVARGHGGDLTYLTGNVGAHFRLTIPVARVLDSHQPRHARPGQPDFEISPV